MEVASSNLSNVGGRGEGLDPNSLITPSLQLESGSSSSSSSSSSNAPQLLPPQPHNGDDIRSNHNPNPNPSSNPNLSSSIEGSSTPINSAEISSNVGPLLNNTATAAISATATIANTASNNSINSNNNNSSFSSSSNNTNNISNNESAAAYNTSNNEKRESSPQGRYFRLEDLLGSGAYKDVWRAYDTNEGIEVAWNVVKLSRIPPNERKRIKTEVKLLKDLEHPNIIRYFNSWVDREKEQIVFITEIMSSGSLKDYLRKSPMIRWAAVKRWCLQILEGLKFLHANHIIHRDIKCDNIFINGATGELRIGDLGLSTRIAEERSDASFGSNSSNSNRIVTSSSMTCVGTPEFMAPELYEEVYDEKVDIYAFGMTLLEMVTGLMPYHQCTSAAQIYKKVTNGEPPPELELVGSSSQKGKEFIELCLLLYDRRPSAKELLENVFLLPNEDEDFKEVRTRIIEDPTVNEDSRIESGEYQSEASSHGSISRANLSGEIINDESSYRASAQGKASDVTEDSKAPNLASDNNESSLSVLYAGGGGGVQAAAPVATRSRNNSNALPITHQLDSITSTLQFENQVQGQNISSSSSSSSAIIHHNDPLLSDENSNVADNHKFVDPLKSIASSHSSNKSESSDGGIDDYNINMLQSLSQTHTALLRRKIVDSNLVSGSSGSLDGSSPINSRGNSAVQTRGVWGIKHNSSGSININGLSNGSSSKHSSGDYSKGNILNDSFDSSSMSTTNDVFLNKVEKSDHQLDAGGDAAKEENAAAVSFVDGDSQRIQEDDSRESGNSSSSNDIFNGLVNSIKKIAKISLSTYVCDIQPMDGSISVSSFDTLVFHMRLAFNITGTQMANMKDFKIAHYEIEFDFNINNDDVGVQSEEMLQYIINNCKLIEHSQSYLDVIITAYKPFVDSWLTVRNKFADAIAKAVTEGTLEIIHKSFIESIIVDVLSREECFSSSQFYRIREKFSHLIPSLPHQLTTSMPSSKSSNHYSNSNSNGNNSNINNSNNNNSNSNNSTSNSNSNNSDNSHHTVVNTATSSSISSSSLDNTFGLNPSIAIAPQHDLTTLLSGLQARNAEGVVSICSTVGLPAWLLGSAEYIDLLEKYNAAVGKIEKELENRMGVISMSRVKTEETYKREKDQLVTKMEDLKSQLITMQDKQKERIQEVEVKKKQLEMNLT